MQISCYTKKVQKLIDNITPCIPLRRGVGRGENRGKKPCFLLGEKGKKTVLII